MAYNHEILNQIYLHMQEMVNIIDPDKPDYALEMQWFERAKAFVEDLKTWRPEIYVYVEGGVVQGASANCDMHFNLFDADNEKEEKNYQENAEDWDNIINEGTERGFLKPIF